MDNSSDNNFNFSEYGQNSQKKSALRRTGGFIWEMLKVAFISLMIILPVRYFLIQPFYVKGASMEPNFYDHEYLIIDELTYRWSEPNRGDIAVFKYPKDTRQYFIKRVIGLPGEKITIEDGKVYIQAKDKATEILQENYLSADLQTALPLKGYGAVELGPDEYFVLGDNRNESLDSRIFGPIKREFIIGRTWLRGWPLDRLTVFNAPEYNL